MGRGIVPPPPRPHRIRRSNSSEKASMSKVLLVSGMVNVFVQVFSKYFLFYQILCDNIYVVSGECMSCQVKIVKTVSQFERLK